MVGDVDALRRPLPARRSARRSSRSSSAPAACVATALMLPAAGARARAGLLVGGLAVPALALRLGRAAGERQSAARAELTAELVELLRGAPELVAYGREDETLARVRDADAELARLGRRDALVAGIADSLTTLVAGLTAVGVLAVAVSAHDAGSLDRVLVAIARAARARVVRGGDAAAGGRARARRRRSRPGRRVLELIDREPDDPRPGRAAACARRRRASRSRA